jgi:hypothetical protein
MATMRVIESLKELESLSKTIPLFAPDRPVLGVLAA